MICQRSPQVAVESAVVAAGSTLAVGFVRVLRRIGRVPTAYRQSTGTAKTHYPNLPHRPINVPINTTLQYLELTASSPANFPISRFPSAAFVTTIVTAAGAFSFNVLGSPSSQPLPNLTIEVHRLPNHGHHHNHQSHRCRNDTILNFRHRFVRHVQQSLPPSQTFSVHPHLLRHIYCPFRRLNNRHPCLNLFLHNCCFFRLNHCFQYN